MASGSIVPGGPWQWRVNRAAKTIDLMGQGTFGRYDHMVMSFERYGMSGAAPVFWNWTGNTGTPMRADQLCIAAPNRDHHADWFALIDHPIAHLIEAAPEAIESCLLLVDGNPMKAVVKAEEAIAKALSVG